MKLLNQGFLLVKLKSLLRKFYGCNHDLVDCYGISVSQLTKDMFHLSSTRPFRFVSRLITRFVTRLARQVPLVEQELLTLQEHLSSPPVFSGVRVTRSLVLCVMFCRSLFVLLYFFFWPLCLLFFDLRILITPLVLSISSISCHDRKRKMVHVINSSSTMHTLHTETTIQEIAINCRWQEVIDKLLSINVHYMQFQYEFS